LPVVEALQNFFRATMSFDTLAPHYRWMEFVTAGGMLQRCRTRFLNETQNCREALLLGEGPGRFLVELLRENPRVKVTCVEGSSRMIEQARRQLRREGLGEKRIEFQQCDALAWEPAAGAYDLVATHFFLDCFRRDELERLIAKISLAAAPDACWLLTDFCVPQRGWRRWRARAVVAMMYLFFRAMTGLSATRLAPTGDLMESAGFALKRQHSANFGLVRAQLWKRQQP
jgi:SAM-dependent methyltransferase